MKALSVDYVLKICWYLSIYSTRVDIMYQFTFIISTYGHKFACLLTGNRPGKYGILQDQNSWSSSPPNSSLKSITECWFGSVKIID